MSRFILIIALMISFGFSARDKVISQADPYSYLSELKEALQLKWPENRTINLVFHGHSVPAGYFKTPVVNTLSSYPQIVLRELKEMYPYAVINAIVTGIGGENSVSGAERFDRDVLPHKPDVLFIDYGLNDRGPGLGKAYAAWDEMIKTAKKHNIRIILLTPSPDQRVDYQDSENELKKHRDQIVRLASENNAGLADSYKAFEFLYNDREKLSEYMSQVNHPNERGHELIASEIMKWFKPDIYFNKADIDPDTLKAWSLPYRNWHYYPDLVIPANPHIAEYENIKMTDVPTVFQVPGDDKWYMSFIGFDGKGYQSFIAESTDLLNWSNYRLAMGYGPEGSFDYGGVVLGAYLYDSYDIKAARILKWQDSGGKIQERKYYSLYGAYPRQGGYELRPGYEGIAFSKDGLTWERVMDKPILSVYDDGCGVWEQSCIYQPWLIEHEGRYYNIYNAANDKVEQMGLAVSDDLMNWKRYENNPVIPNGPEGSYNEVFSSDIKIFRDNGHWTGFFFGVGRGGAHIMAAYSYDLYNWTVDPEPLYKAGGNPSGIDSRYAHKISLVWNSEEQRYYMFYCAVDDEGTRGIGLITSEM